MSMKFLWNQSAHMPQIPRNPNVHHRWPYISSIKPQSCQWRSIHRCFSSNCRNALWKTPPECQSNLHLHCVPDCRRTGHWQNPAYQWKLFVPSGSSKAYPGPSGLLGERGSPVRPAPGEAYKRTAPLPAGSPASGNKNHSP